MLNQELARRRIVFLYFMLTIVFTAEGQSIIHDFKYDWLTYNQTESQYLPASLDPDNAIHFNLEPTQFSDFSLLIRTKGAGIILIDAALVKQVRRSLEEYMIWPLDSLEKIYNKENLVITLAGFDKIIQTVIVNHDNRNDSIAMPAKSIIKPIPLNSESLSDTWLTILLIMGLCFAYFRNAYPKFFETYFSISGALRSRIRDENFHESRLFDPFNILFYAIISMMLSLLFDRLTGQGFPLENFSAISFGFGYFGMAFAVFFIFILLKYVVNAIFGSLFGLGSFARIQFFEYLRLLGMLLLVIFGASFILPIIFREGLSIILFNGLAVGVFIMSLLMLFIKLINRSSYKKKYLFIYICSTELIPLCLLIIFITSI